MDGFTDIVKGEVRRGFKVIVRDLEQRFPDPAKIETQAEKKDFTKLFGEFLRVIPFRIKSMNNIAMRF